MTAHNSLIQLNGITQALAEVKTIQEVKDIRDKAEALRIYAKQANYSLGIQNDCAEIKIRAERKAGIILSAANLKPGPKAISSIVEPISLKDSGVTKKESHRWQRVASVPDDALESHIAEAKDSRKELTTASVLKLANTFSPKNGAVVIEKHDGDFVSDLSAINCKQFGCIYADPPWQYSNQGTRASTGNHYGTMTVEEICALPVKDLAADKSHLHLWTTNAFLFECPKIFEAWGFVFKSSFVWVKPQMGIGNYWRNSHEIMLLAVRGGLTGQAKDLMSWAKIEREMHSAKPESIRTMVEKLSPGPYLELFGRHYAKNWTVFGNQILPSQTHLEVQ
jgi:N6-adenosine-specific RNA methylase IME4